MLELIHWQTWWWSRKI